MRCLRCKNETDNRHGHCTECVEEIITTTRREQGLPPKVEDPLVLDRIATLIRGRGAA